MISKGLSDFESRVQRHFFDIFRNSKTFFRIRKLRTRFVQVCLLTYDFYIQTSQISITKSYRAENYEIIQQPVLFL